MPLNYFDRQQHKFDRWRAKYPNSPRKVALRMAWWNFKNLFRPLKGTGSRRRFCDIPWRNAWIEHNYNPKYANIKAGDVQCCCWCLVKDGSANGGNLAEKTFGQAWNSPQIQEFRSSILDGSFRYCLKDCERLKNLPPDDGRFTSTIAPPPEAIDLNYDETYNIFCPQCRKFLIVANGEKAAVLWKIHDNFAASVDNPARLAITSGGDCFASQIYLKFLQNFDETKFRDTKITLRTNGLLFKKYWDSIKKVHKRIDEVMISIDAACRETYEKVRRGGNWERLLENLEFIKEVNGRDANFSYMMPFCVQKANFREMGDYVDFAEKYGATCVLFMFLLPNGDLTGEAYDDAAVFKPAHPLYTEYRGLLIDPRLYRPIVSLPNEMRV